MKTFFPTAAFAAALFLSCGVYAGIESEVFIRGLQDEKFWTRVHAAEYLTQSDPGNIHLQKWLADAEKRYTALPVKRVGVWRVKALKIQSSGNTDKTIQQLYGYLKKTAFTPDAPDRIHAFETLFKLRVPLEPAEILQLKKAVLDKTSPPALRIYGAALWSLNDPAEGNSILLEIFNGAKIGSIEKYLPLFVWKNSSALPASVLDAVNNALVSQKYSPSMQMIMLGILLNHQKITLDEFFLQAGKLQTNGAELLRITVKHAPGKSRQMIKQCAASADIELQMLAAWANIKIRNR